MLHFSVRRNLFVATLLLVTFAATFVDAANYFLDSVNGADSNDGLQPSSAWKTGSGLKDKLSPGDKLILIAVQNPSFNPDYTFGGPGSESDTHIWNAEDSLKLSEVKGTPEKNIVITTLNNQTVLRGDGKYILHLHKCQNLQIVGVRITGQTKSISYEHGRYLQFAYKESPWDSAPVKFRVDPTFTDEQIATANFESDFGVSHRPSWTTTAGIYMYQSGGITIADSKIEYMPGNGIYAYQCTFVIIVGNEIQFNAMRSAELKNEGVAAAGITLYKPMDRGADKQSTTGLDYRVYIIRNQIHHNHNEMLAWKLKSQPRTGPLDPHIGRYGAGIHIIDKDWIRDGEGRVLIANNVIFWNGIGAIHTENSERIDVMANTMYMNVYTNAVSYATKPKMQKSNQVYGAEVTFDNSQGDNNMWNNIIVTTSKYSRKWLYHQQAGTYDTNLWFSPDGSVTDTAHTSDSKALKLNPKFANVGPGPEGPFDFVIRGDAVDVRFKGNPAKMPCHDILGKTRGTQPNVGAVEQLYGVVPPQPHPDSNDFFKCYPPFATSSSPPSTQQIPQGAPAPVSGNNNNASSTNATKKAGPTVVTTLNLGSITAEPSQAAIKKSMADSLGAGIEASDVTLKNIVYPVKTNMSFPSFTVANFPKQKFIGGLAKDLQVPAAAFNITSLTSNSAASAGRRLLQAAGVEVTTDINGVEVFNQAGGLAQKVSNPANLPSTAADVGQTPVPVPAIVTMTATVEIASDDATEAGTISAKLENPAAKASLEGNLNSNGIATTVEGIAKPKTVAASTTPSAATPTTSGEKKKKTTAKVEPEEAAGISGGTIGGAALLAAGGYGYYKYTQSKADNGKKSKKAKGRSSSAKEKKKKKKKKQDESSDEDDSSDDEGSGSSGADESASESDAGSESESDSDDDKKKKKKKKKDKKDKKDKKAKNRV